MQTKSPKMFFLIYITIVRNNKKGIPLLASHGSLYTTGKGQLFIFLPFKHRYQRPTGFPMIVQIYEKKIKYTNNAIFQLCSPGHS